MTKSLKKKRKMTKKTPGSNILGIILENQKLAKNKLSSGEMLFEDQKKHYHKVLGIRQHRPKNRRIKAMAKVPFEGKEADAVADLIDTFDPGTANKKEIREFRKALGELSKAKYPKGAKKKASKEDKE